jgi:hypothetical protein
MIFGSTTGLQISAYGSSESFKADCLNSAARASSNLQVLAGAGQNRLAAMLNFTDLCQYEYTLGIPIPLALTLDYFALKMDLRSGANYLMRALEAIQPDAHLSHVFPRYLAWFLDDSECGLIRFAERRTTSSAIRKVAAALRDGAVFGNRSSGSIGIGEQHILTLRYLSGLEGSIAQAKASELESLDIAEHVPQESANSFTTDSIVASIAERVGLLAKKLLLDGCHSTERVSNRALATGAQSSFQSSDVPPRFMALDMMAGSVASIELWTRIVLLMQKIEDVSVDLSEQPFSLLMHSEKLIDLMRVM